MGNRDAILGLLKRVEKRARANRFMTELASALFLCFLVPVAFKLIDLVYPFRGRTVAIGLGLWAIASIAYIVWRTRGKSSLGEAAVTLDRKAALQDELKTAYWFIENPKESEWVDAQIERAAKTAGRLNSDELVPRVVPSRAWAVGALVMLLVILNFLPLPMNYNWLRLQGAPALMLTAAEKALIEEARKLIEKAEELKKTELTEKAKEILLQLEKGNLTVQEAMQQLQNLQQKLSEGNLDAASINDGLEEIAKDLQSSQQLAGAAQAISGRRLQSAADQLRQLAALLPNLTPEQLRSLVQALQQAGQNQRAALQELTGDMRDAAEAIAAGQGELSQEALAQIAQQLEQLAEDIGNQQALNAAGEGLQGLQQALGRGQGRGDGLGQGQGEGQGEGQGQGDGDGTGNGEGNSEAGGRGRGGRGYGRGNAQVVAEDDATELGVQLKKEALVGVSSQQRPGQVEEASSQQRSKLDYRNVASELSPAQKDVLNQDRLPFEDRQIIKDYFQAIHPQQNSK